MTVKQAATRLEVSSSLIYSLISAGKLRYSRVGHGRGRIRVSEDAIAEYLASCTFGVVTREEKPVPKMPRLTHLDV